MTKWFGLGGRVWGCHLDMPENDLRDPSEAANQLRVELERLVRTNHVTVHYPKRARSEVARHWPGVRVNSVILEERANDFDLVVSLFHQQFPGCEFRFVWRAVWARLTTADWSGRNPELEGLTSADVELEASSFYTGMEEWFAEMDMAQARDPRIQPCDERGVAIIEDL